MLKGKEEGPRADISDGVTPTTDIYEIERPRYLLCVSRVRTFKKCLSMNITTINHILDDIARTNMDIIRYFEFFDQLMKADTSRLLV